MQRGVDRLKINPRKAELELTSELRDLGSRAAKVVVERQDCPTNRVPATAAP